RAGVSGVGVTGSGDDSVGVGVAGAALVGADVDGADVDGAEPEGAELGRASEGASAMPRTWICVPLCVVNVPPASRARASSSPRQRVIMPLPLARRPQGQAGSKG